MERDPESDCFIGADNCHYDTEWEARSIGTLGMCGCGTPEEAYNFLREVLRVCDRRDRTKEWVSAEAVVSKMIAAHPDLTAHILMHFLTDKEVIEHGGSVGGSWLTKTGEEIVDGEPAPTEDE